MIKTPVPVITAMLNECIFSDLSASSPVLMCVCCFFFFPHGIDDVSKLSKLELLEELNVSGNKLKTVPSTVSSCKRLHTLISHSNHITVFPEVLNLPEIKVSVSHMSAITMELAQVMS